MGEGNFQDYGMRMYNPRIGRFFSTDPLAPDYPHLTPYQFASNTPISAIDLDGLEAEVVIGGEPAGKTLIFVHSKDETVQMMIVEVYRAIVQYKDPKGNVTNLGEFYVTRDGWFNLGTDKNNEDVFVNRSSDPDANFKGKIYITKHSDPSKYAKDTPTFSLSEFKSTIPKEYNSTYLKGGKPDGILEDDVKRKDNIVKGAQIHPGGYFDNGNGPHLGGTFGCYGIVDPTQVKQTTEELIKMIPKYVKMSNEVMKEFGKKVDSALEMAKKDFGGETKVEAKIEKRDFSRN
jgi:hypothetical protein